MSNELQDRSYDLTHLGGVKFDEDTHSYYNMNEEKYISGTTILKEFKNPFNENESMSRYKAIKDILKTDSFNKLKSIAKGWDNVYKYFDKLLEKDDKLKKLLLERNKHYLDKWATAGEEAALKGSIEHNKREQDLIKNGYTFNNKYYQYSNKNILEITDTDCIVIPECLLWNHLIKAGGLSDILLAESGYIHIHDYKTNKSIDREAFNNQKLKGILSHIPDASFYHYSLQLEIYKKMACDLTGLKPGESWIIHTKSEEYNRKEDIYIKCQDMTKEVNLIWNKYAK